MPPSREPAVAQLLHRLARKLTKAHMHRLGEHSYTLHPHLDELSDWLHPGSGRPQHSRLLVSHSLFLEEHVDRGLFNIVFGSVADLATLQLIIDGACCLGLLGRAWLGLLLDLTGLLLHLNQVVKLVGVRPAAQTAN